MPSRGRPPRGRRRRPIRRARAGPPRRTMRPAAALRGRNPRPDRGAPRGLPRDADPRPRTRRAMVNFFIGRPIFATVLALLMMLIGGICIFVLPISLYPDIVPPQVQITATYTGADAQTVADSVTTPIEQKVNGVNGMIYMSSDSTSNGLSRILVTLDVGMSQDIGAIDVQNKVDTAKPTLPPEVTQIGVESKKTTTNMVCVVNLVSPKGTYDSNFLDNYAQINVIDALKRVRGISDVYVFG